MARVKRRVVLVEWLDPCSASGWRTEKAELAPAVCVSAGLEMQRSRKGMVIAQSISNTGQHAEPLSLPRAVIRKVRHLAWVEEPEEDE